jgi:hypothetical protein
MIISFLNDAAFLPTVCIAHGHKEHNCSICTYWLMQDRDFCNKSLDEKVDYKKAYLDRAKIGLYGYVVAKGDNHIVGLLQIAPLSEFHRKLDFDSDISHKDTWSIVCLQAKNGSEEIKQQLLGFAIDHMRKNVSFVHTLTSSTLKDKNTSGMSSSGSAEPFLAVGFVETEHFKNGFVKLEYKL